MSSAAHLKAKERAAERIRGIIEKQGASGRLRGKDLYEGIAQSGPGGLNAFDRAEVAPILAQYIAENPEVRLKGVSKYTGVERDKDTGTIAFSPTRTRANSNPNVGIVERELAPDDARFVRNSAGGFTWVGASAAAKAAAAATDDTPAASRPPLETPASLTAARDAYDRASSWSDPGGSAATGIPDLSKTGGELFKEIYGAGRDLGDDYSKRFLPYLKSRSDLAAEEIGYATRSAISDLPEDIKLPAYTDPFKDTSYGKKGGKSLFEYLKGSIA